MVNDIWGLIMKHKITFSKFKGFNRIVELENLQDAINDFIRQNKGLKVCNVCYKDDALIGHIKDLDDFDYGMIIIKKVVS